MFGCYPFLSPGPSPEFIKQVRARVRAGFYPFRVRVRILSSMSGSTSGFYQHSARKPSWSCVCDLNKFPSQCPMEAPYEIWLQTAQCFLLFFLGKELKMLNLSDLGQKPMNDLDLGLSLIIMYSFIWLYDSYIYLTSFINLQLKYFQIQNTKGTKFDLAVK